MTKGGWVVGRSIALELDVALSVFSGYDREKEIPPEALPLFRGVAQDWKAEWPELLGHPRLWITLLADMASVAGVLLEEDYSRATLAMRELTLAGALEGLAERVQGLGLAPDGSLPPAERLADLAARTIAALDRQMDLEPVSEELFMRQAAYEASRLVRVLRDGDLHARFWLWLDRFYFEFYRPWRDGQLEAMAAREEQAIMALGAREQTGAAPELAWLPPQNPLHHLPELGEAARAGRVKVLFWTQPFGFFDYWSLTPEILAVSYGVPQRPMAEFLREHAESIADRAKALSDPTRLVILRHIRNFGADNTQMAEYLGIARPTVSIHAKVLREAGLIDTRQEGRAALHSLNPAAVRQLFRDLASFLQLPEEDA